MDIREVKTWLGADWERVQDLMARSLGSDIELLNRVNGSILSSGGKQIRPVLSLLVSRACGRINEDSYLFAVAGELLHNATLLHDDVADESPTRRGLPTVYSLMGPSTSVLLGDFWLVRAMNCILKAKRNVLEVTEIFSKTLGALAEGEMLQLQKAENSDTTQADYLRIIYSKTASLFEAVAVSAAISVEASTEIVEAVRSAAMSLGMAFQMRDDILDYTPGLDIGKPVGADILERKITLPLLGAFANAGAAEEARIRALVRNLDGKPSAREEICAFVRENGGLEYAQNRLDGYIAGALEAMEILPDTEEKQLLCRVINYVGERRI